MKRKYKIIHHSLAAKKDDPIISSRGYIVNSAEMRQNIQKIEKEIIQTRNSIYGKSRMVESKQTKLMETV